MTVFDPGRVSYDDAMRLMEERHALRLAGSASDAIFVLEHDPPVITKGRRLHDVPVPRQEEILARGIQIRQADRGGLLTYHGPGQIVAYFVLRLEDYFTGIGALVQTLEGVLVEFLSRHGVVANTDPAHPGIWVGGKKIASLGLRVERGVTKHGISLNVNNDLRVYDLFDPCGLSGNTMTTLDEAIGARRDAPLGKLAAELAEGFRLRLTESLRTRG